MEIFFAVGQIIAGLYMTAIGFKIYNPFKGKNEPEKEEQWFKKFGAFFKYSGIALVILGIFSTYLK